jgi:putative transposase
LRTTVRADQAEPVPDLVQRNFKAEAPNQLWLADFTYVPTLAGFLFLAVVIDAFSRRVIGWAMGPHVRTNPRCLAVQGRLPRRVSALAASA